MTRKIIGHEFPYYFHAGMHVALKLIQLPSAPLTRQPLDPLARWRPPSRDRIQISGARHRRTVLVLVLCLCLHHSVSRLIARARIDPSAQLGICRVSSRTRRRFPASGSNGLLRGASREGRSGGTLWGGRNESGRNDQGNERKMRRCKCGRNWVD